MQKLIFNKLSKDDRLNWNYSYYFNEDWMAPEVIESSPYSFSADVYSFGVYIYYKDCFMGDMFQKNSLL